MGTSLGSPGLATRSARTPKTSPTINASPTPNTQLGIIDAADLKGRLWDEKDSDTCSPSSRRTRRTSPGAMVVVCARRSRTQSYVELARKIVRHRAAIDTPSTLDSPTALTSPPTPSSDSSPASRSPSTDPNPHRPRPGSPSAAAHPSSQAEPASRIERGNSRGPKSRSSSSWTVVGSARRRGADNGAGCAGPGLRSSEGLAKLLDR